MKKIVITLLISCLLPLGLAAQTGVAEQEEKDKAAVQTLDRENDAKVVEQTGKESEAAEAEKQQDEADEIKTMVKKPVRITHVGGTAGPVFRMPIMPETYGLLVGVRGGVLLNHSFLIGGSICGLATRMSNESLTGKNTLILPYERLYMMYGGLLLEYVFFPKFFVNFSIGTVVGGGYIANNYDFENDKSKDRSVRPFFLVEPELTLYFNVMKYFKIGISASYRDVELVNYYEVRNEDIRGFSVALMCMFGKF